MSSFSGVSTALSALQSHRRAMDVAGNNIANANTAGYTRQRADLAPMSGQAVPSLFAAGGVTAGGVRVSDVNRMSDEFLNAKVRSQTSNHADLAGRAETLTSIERIVNEPSTTGLSSQLGKMWNAWSTLVNSPSDDSARVAVLNASQGVADALVSAATQVETLWDQARAGTVAMVQEVNARAADVADFNKKIKSIVSSGGEANELMDQRDQAVVRLAELTGAAAEPPDQFGVVNVYLGGNALVREGRAEQVAVTGEPSKLGETALRSPTGSDVAIVWRGTTTSVGTMPGGALAASLHALTTTIPTEANRYDEVATALATAVNTQHAKGVQKDGVTPGEPFFAGLGSAPVTAATIRLALTSTGQVAAGTADQGPKDGSNADLMAKLALDPAGPDAVWAAHVVDIGSQKQTAALRATVNAATMAASIGDQQASAGVSLDEETANLLVLQRAYEGAARVLTAVDAALDTLINRTGLVGR